MYEYICIRSHFGSRGCHQLNSSQALTSALSMAPMKAMNAKAMTEDGIAETLSTRTEMKNACLEAVPGACNLYDS